MARILQINVSPGGVPRAAVPFGRALRMPDGRTEFSGYLWGAEQSHFHHLRGATLVARDERRMLGLESLNLMDWGSRRRERYLVRILNIREDRQYHGSPDQTVCLFAWERILELREQGFPIFAGALGENITTEGLNHTALREGFLVGIGEKDKRGMVIRLSEPRGPCQTVESYAAIRNELEGREDKDKLHLVKAVGFAKDPADPKFGGSGWYAGIEEIWGSGIVIPLDPIRVIQ